MLSALALSGFLAVFPTSPGVKDRPGGWGGGVMWLQSTFVPFYLREMLAGTRPVCPAFESITPPNRLTINAHTADYISDGCLGGKHCDGSANTRGTVTDTRLRSVPSLTHAGGGGRGSTAAFCHSV